MQVSNFDDASELLMIVKITTKRLYLMAYSAYQKSLFQRVLELRERNGMTFDAIAQKLTSEKYLSPRGVALMAEHVFSIYKKGKLRRERLSEVPTYELMAIQSK